MADTTRQRVAMGYLVQTFGDEYRRLSRPQKDALVEDLSVMDRVERRNDLYKSARILRERVGGRGPRQLHRNPRERELI
jgi:hypothetical protein